MFTLYGEHRKKAKAKFKRNGEALAQLKISTAQPTSYIKQVEAVKQFYGQIVQNQDLANGLLSFNVQAEALGTATSLIAETEQLRAAYIKKEGESQDATKIKNKALGELETWMQDFYAMADIALENNQQLLEAIGLFRKS